MTQLTTSDDQTTLVVTEVKTLAEINCQKQGIFGELPVLQYNTSGWLSSSGVLTHITSLSH
jgi:hypothetical protein